MGKVQPTIIHLFMAAHRCQIFTSTKVRSGMGASTRAARRCVQFLLVLQGPPFGHAGNKSHLSLSQQPIVGHKVRPAIAKDSLKRPGTKGIRSPFKIPGQNPNLTSVEQDWKHQGPEDLDFRPPAQVPTAPNPVIQ